MKTHLLLGAIAVFSVVAAQAETFYATTTDNRLVSFDSADPDSFLSSVSITGLLASDGVTSDPNAVLVNLSLNPVDNQFYGIDTNANFYRVNSSGAATLIDNTFAPTGFAAGFAFDPFFERFVFASDTGENVLISANGSRTARPTLAYADGDANEGNLPSIFALGIDSDFGTGFFLDAVNGVLGTSLDPAFAEIFTVGSLGTSFVAFGGVALDYTGALFGALSTDGLTSSLYSINTSTGLATLVGNFDTGVGIHSLTVAPVPEPAAWAIVFPVLMGFLIWRRRRQARA